MVHSGKTGTVGLATRCLMFSKKTIGGGGGSREYCVYGLSLSWRNHGYGECRRERRQRDCNSGRSGGGSRSYSEESNKILCLVTHFHCVKRTHELFIAPLTVPRNVRKSSTITMTGQVEAATACNLDLEWWMLGA